MNEKKEKDNKPRSHYSFESDGKNWLWKVILRTATRTLWYEISEMTQLVGGMFNIVFSEHSRSSCALRQSSMRAKF